MQTLQGLGRGLTSLKIGVAEQISNVNKILERIFNQLKTRNFSSKSNILELSVDIHKIGVLITNHCFEFIKVIALNTCIWPNFASIKFQYLWTVTVMPAVSFLSNNQS